MAAVIGTLRAELQATIAQFQKDMGKAADTIRGMSAEFSKIGRNFQQSGRQIESVGKALTKTVTLPLAAIGVAAAKIGIDFESSFAGVRKTVDATEKEFAQMANSLRGLSKTIPVNVNELNRLAEAAGALGVPKEDIVDFARVMAQLGVTTNVTSDQAAESIAKIQNQFGALGKDTDRFASTLVALGNSGASTEQEILGLATRIASAGSAIKLTQGEVLGFAAAIADVGMEAEAGGSAFSRVAQDIAVAVSQGGSALEEFARVAGQSTQQFAQLFRDDASEAIVQFVEGLGKIKTSGGDLIGTINELGFTELRQADLLRRLAGNSDNVRDSLQRQAQAWQDNSALSKEAGERFKTTASQLQLLVNRISDVGITLFNAMKPAIDSAIVGINRLLPIIEKAAQAFGELPGSVQLTVIAIGAAAAAMGPLLIVAGQVVGSIGTLAGAFGKGGIATKGLTTALDGLSRALGALNALKLSPTMLRLLGLAGGASLAAIPIAVAANQAEQLERDLAAMDPSKRGATAIPGARDGLISLAEAQAQVAKTAAEMGDAWEAALPASVQTQVATTNAGTAARSLSDQLRAAAAEIAALSPAMRQDLTQAIQSGVFEMEELQKQSGLSERALKLFEDQISRDAKAAKDAADDFRKFNLEIQNLRFPQTATGGGLNLIPALPTSVEEQFTDLAQVSRNFSRELIASQIEVDMLGNAIRVDLEPSLRGLKKTFDEGTDEAIGFGDALKSAVSGRGFGDFGKALKGSLGQIKTGIFEGFGNLISGGISSLISSGIGLLGKGIGKLFNGLFGTAGRDAVREFAAVEGGFDNLHKKLGTLGPEGERLWKTLTQGVGRNNPEQAKAAIAQVTAALDAQKQRFEALQGAIGQVSGKLQGITVITPEIQAALENVWDETTTQGYLAAVEQLNGALTDQAQKYTEIETALQKYGLSLEEAGKEFQQAKLNQGAQQLQKDFETLAGAGVDINAQMRAMGESIRAFIDDAKRGGLEVPESMRHIIQVAINAGEVFDENGDKITDMSQLGLTFGKTMETSMKTVGTAIERLNGILEHFARFLGVTLPDAAEQGARDVQAALNAIEPPDLTIDVNTRGIREGDRDWEDWPGAARGASVKPWGLQYLTGGGVVGRRFRRGTDTIAAMLTPGELVLNAAQQENVAAAIDQPRTPNLSLTFTGPVLAQREYVEQQLVPWIVAGIERYGLREFARLMRRAAPGLHTV